MERFVKGDVVVIDFPFSDLKASKRRPVLVLKVPAGGDIIACQMTASSYESGVEVKLTDKDFKKGKLKRESFVRIDKIASIEKSLIKYKVGLLKGEKFFEILEKVLGFLKE